MRVTDENGKILTVVMSLCSILTEIEVPTSGKPLFIIIAATGDGKFEGAVHTQREREEEATKTATDVASAIMYHLIFVLEAHPDDIAKFIQVRFSIEHVKVAM